MDNTIMLTVTSKKGIVALRRHDDGTYEFMTKDGTIMTSADNPGLPALWHALKRLPDYSIKDVTRGGSHNAH
jgi:hypothetical protein